MRRQAREELLASAYTKLEEAVQLLHEAGENVIAEQRRLTWWTLWLRATRSRTSLALAERT